MSKLTDRLSQWWHAGDHHYRNPEIGSEDEHELQRLLRAFRASGDKQGYNDTLDLLHTARARRIAGEEAFEEYQAKQEQGKNFGKTADRSKTMIRPLLRRMI